VEYWFDSQQSRIFTFFRAIIPTLELTQPHVQWVPGALSPEVKWLGRESNHSSLSSAEVKNKQRYTFTPAIRLHGVDRKKFTL
jgi:hypothetical protein